MKFRFVPVIIMLIAGLAACIVCIVYNRSVIDTMKITLIVLIIFYIIGVIAKKIFDKFLVINIATDSEEISGNSFENGEEIEDININVEKK